MIKFIGKIQKKLNFFFVDSGSTHYLLSSKLVKSLNLKLSQETRRHVELASDKKSFTKGHIENLSLFLMVRITQVIFM